MPVEAKTTGWAPTRKWTAATVTAAVGLVVLFVEHGWHLDEHTTIALATIVGQRIISYLIPNDDTPGGVPDAMRLRNERGQMNVLAIVVLSAIVAAALVILLLRA